ncbi:MAG: hypothetical protein ACFFAV_00535 [Candidatus Hermodarchaeota archaeon]
MDMFNLEEFDNELILEKVNRLNKYLNKNKVDRVSKILDELLSLMDDQEYVVPITYILSILAENRITLISKELIKKVEAYLHSENLKLKINSLIIIGFVILKNPQYLEKYSREFIKFLLDEFEDVRNNVHYFLIKLFELNPEIIKKNVDIIIKSFKIENNNQNIISLLNLLEYCEISEFDHLYQVRSLSIKLLKRLKEKENSQIFNKLLGFIKKVYLQLEKFDLESLDYEKIIDLLNNQFLMKKTNFTELSKKEKLGLKEYLKKFLNSKLKDEKVFFYLKTKENIIYIYELEKSKLKRFFEQNQKISDDEITSTFSQVIENSSELKRFIKTLIKLKIIEGYYSNLGFFYPFNFIRSKFMEGLNENGSISIKSFNFLPQNFIEKIIMDISRFTNQRLLKHKDQETYSSLKHIKNQINSEAAKNSTIELKPYRTLLLDSDFLELIKNLPREFLSKYHKGTQWLTNLGVQKISNEVQNSRIVGYFDIPKLSEKLNIGELLLLDVFEQFVDFRSGIWNRKRNTFYYSKFLKDKVNEISLVVDENEKIHQIEMISKELDIDKNHILSKIDENLQLIAEEIKQQDQIKLDVYLQKTGMELDAFLRFIDDLNIFYFKKGDFLILNPQKIEDAKNEIRYMLIDKSKSDDFISLGTIKFVQSTLIEELIKELQNDGKVKGIFHENEGELIFYTERGIRSLMLENSLLFSFHDLFYDKELIQEEIDLMMQIFEDLVSKGKLKGHFDETSLTFSSDEVLFVKDYNTVLFEFEKMVSNYIRNFETEFNKISKILSKREETIFPQEIKIIQETIDKINEKYVNWRSGLEAFIRKTNKKVLKDQGISVKQYKTILSKDKKDEIKSFEEDPEVHDLLNNFNNWVKRYNKIELKYPNVIFYQKRLINNPEDKESNSKLNDLLDELDLR